MAEGKLNLIIDNPTDEWTDGKPAADSTQAYPVNMVINTSTASHALYKAALRCASGYKTSDEWELSFAGPSAGAWRIADGPVYANAQDAEDAEYKESLASSETIGETNHVIWLKAMTNGETENTVDVSTVLRLRGKCVSLDESSTVTIDEAFGLRRVVQIPSVEPEKSIDHAERMRGHLISQFQWEVLT